LKRICAPSWTITKNILVELIMFGKLWTWSKEGYREVFFCKYDH